MRHTGFRILQLVIQDPHFPRAIVRVATRTNQHPTPLGSCSISHQADEYEATIGLRDSSQVVSIYRGHDGCSRRNWEIVVYFSRDANDRFRKRYDIVAPGNAENFDRGRMDPQCFLRDNQLDVLVG
jgi:hypothetical protein